MGAGPQESQVHGGGPLQAPCLPGHQKGRVALPAPPLGRYGEHHEQGGHGAVGEVGLLPGKDKGAPFAPGHRGELPGVAPHAGLGDGQAGDLLPRGERRQAVALLPVRAEAQDHEPGDEDVHEPRQRRAQAAAVLHQGLGGDCHVQPPSPRAPALPGDADREQALLLHGLVQIGGEDDEVPQVAPGRDLLPGKPGNHVLQGLQLVIRVRHDSLPGHSRQKRGFPLLIG